MKSWRTASLAAIALLLAGSVGGVTYVESVRPEPGLRARVFRSPEFDGLPLTDAPDRQLSIERLASAAGIPPGERFGIQWTGWVFAPQGGRHAWDLWVDDGAEVWIGDRLIVEVKGPSGIYRRSGFLDIERGAHRVEIRYRQHVGDLRFSFTWSDSIQREPLSAPEYFQPSDSPPPVALVRDLPRVLAITWSAVILAALAYGFIRFAGISASAAALLTVPRAFALAAPLLLIVLGITWGIYPSRQWQPDEVLPADIIYAVEMKFAGGWARVYPPLRFVLDAIVTSPFLLAERAALVSFDDPQVLTAFHLMMRLLTALMAALTLVVIHALGRETIGGRRALAAVFFAGTGQVLAYYGKSANADIPYVLWVTAAMLFLVRAVRHRRLADHLKLAVAAGLAIGTKDQAFGYFFVPALVLIACRWQETAGGVPARVRDTLMDRRIWLSAAAAVLTGLVAYGVPWNSQGFRAHLDFVLGFNTDFFRMFGSGATGQLQLLLFTLSLLPWTFGVTTLLLAAAGVVVALRRRARLHRLWLIVFSAAGYYLTAIVPVGFIYDRFQLGWMAPVGLMAAIGFDALWRSARRFETIRLAAAAIVLISAIVPAVLIDTEMVNGSRQRIERWLDARVADDPLVVAVANPLYLPRLSAFRHRVLNMVEDNLAAWKGDLVVLNEEWVHRVPFPEGYVEALLQRGSYTEVYRDMARARPWWSQVFTSTVPDNGTNLLKISPSFSVWQIARPAAGLGPL